MKLYRYVSLCDYGSCVAYEECARQELGKEARVERNNLSCAFFVGVNFASFRFVSEEMPYWRP